MNFVHIESHLASASQKTQINTDAGEATNKSRNSTQSFKVFQRSSYSIYYLTCDFG
jgi:hypothetical protein